MELRAAVDSASIAAAVDAGRIMITQTVLAEFLLLHDHASMLHREVLEEGAVLNAMIIPTDGTLDGPRRFLVRFFRRVRWWPPFDLARLIRHSEIHYTLTLASSYDKLTLTITNSLLEVLLLTFD